MSPATLPASPPRAPKRPAEPRPLTATSRLQAARREAMPHDPDGGPWETALAEALHVALVALGHVVNDSLDPQDLRRRELVQLTLNDYRGAQQRYRDQETRS